MLAAPSTQNSTTQLLPTQSLSSIQTPFHPRRISFLCFHCLEKQPSPSIHPTKLLCNAEPITPNFPHRLHRTRKEKKKHCKNSTCKSQNPEVAASPFRLNRRFHDLLDSFDSESKQNTETTPSFAAAAAKVRPINAAPDHKITVLLVCSIIVHKVVS